MRVNTGDQPFYDVRKTYEDNYREGPFAAFADALADPEAEQAGVSSGGQILGFPVRTPFGIPAGPLLNARFTTAAFRMGFDIAVYKTVRSRAWPCNPFPNVLAVHPRSAGGTIDPLGEETHEGILADDRFEEPVSISNSFGVPSRDPDQWQDDMHEAIAAAGEGQLLLPSFQGSRTDGMDTEQYIADHVRTARMIMHTGARIMEMNTSCPNEGLHRLLCDDPHLVGRITDAVKQEIGDIPLIIKLAFIPTDVALNTMVRETVGRGTVQGITAINTISAKLVTASGDQALPGENREHSGVCGYAIKPAGMSMVRRLAAIRDAGSQEFAIIGVGGVESYDDYQAYRALGADAVMSATGAMWNPFLARQIKEHERHGQRGVLARP